MSDDHSPVIEKQFRQRGKCFYRAGCSCGWRAEEAFASQHVAELDFYSHANRERRSE